MAQPLTITDGVLRQIKHGEMSWQFGAISPVMQAMLVMVLPDICSELLTRRETNVPDGDQLDRIEGLAQHVIDDSATKSAQIDTLVDSITRSEAMITEVLTALHCGRRSAQIVLRED